MANKFINANEMMWLAMETRERPMHVATLLVYSLPKDAGPDYLRDMVVNLRDSTEFASPFNKRLLYPPIFSPVPGMLSAVLPVWVEDFDLDMEYHVRHQALPAPGGERELGGLISRLHSNPMDFNRPLWEYHIIEGLENNRFAVYYKMHHSLVDGVAGVRMLQRSMSTDPNEENVPPLWSVGEIPVKSEGVSGAVRKTARALTNAVSVAKGFVEVGKAAFNSEDPYVRPFASPMTVLNHRIHGQRRFATQQYDFERIKALSKAADCTVNDIVLALCSGAIRKFLKDLSALPGKPITAGIPVSLRSKDDQSAGAAVSFIIASLGTHIADPLRRLEAIKASTARSKELQGAMSRDAIETFTSLLYMPLVMQQMTGMEGRTAPVFNLTVSNVPGPREPLYFRGARLEAMYPVSAVTHGQALNITCYSYAGTLTFGIAGCRDTLPRLQRVAVYAGETLEELEQVLLGRTGKNANAGTPKSLGHDKPAKVPPRKPRSTKSKVKPA